MKKASYFFIVDAFIGGTIVFFTIILLLNIRVTEPIIHTTSFTSNDYLQIISGTEVREFRNPYLTNLRSSGLVNDSRMTLLEVMINLKEQGHDLNVSEFIGNFTPRIIPSQTGIKVFIDEENVYSYNPSNIENAQSVSTTRIVMIDSINYNTHNVSVKTWI